MTKECLNCKHSLTDTFDYCPQCGQKTRLHRLTLHEVMHDAVHFFIHADKGIFKLVKALLLKTGNVAKEYVQGMRKKYFPPLNFFLVVATFFVLVMHAVTPHTSFDVLKEHPELSRIPEKSHREHVTQIYERQHKAVAFVNEYSNTISMIAAPLICLIYWLFYIRGKYNYAEHLVACMFMSGFTNLVFVLIYVPLSLLLATKSNYSSLTLISSFMCFQAAYSSIFYYRFMDKRSATSAFKATGVSVFATAFWFFLSWFLVGLYIRNGLWGLLK